MRLLAAAILFPQAVAGQLVPTTDLRVQPILTIGREGDAVTFHRIAQVAVAQSGEIVIADAGNARVVILGADGRLVATVGRRGNGPGEFNSPLGISLGKTAMAFDPPGRRVVEFDLSGKVLETRQLPATGPNITRMFPVASGEFVVATTPRFSTAADSEPNVVVMRASRDFSVLDTLLSFHSGAGIFHSAGGRGGWGLDASDMGPGGAWTMAGDSMVVLGNGRTGEIQWIDLSRSLRPVRTARVGASGRSTSDSDRREFLNRLRAAGRPVPSDAAAHLPAFWSSITQMVAARNGDLWVRGATEPDVWTVIRPSGALAKHRLPPDFHLFEVLPRRLIGVTTTALGEELLTVLEFSAS